MDLKAFYDHGLSVDEYTALLNEDQTDLHRLYERRARVTPQDVDAIRASGPYHVLVITEPWCGDSLAIFPVVARLFSEADCEVRVIRRDERPELIDRYLTHGGRAIPIVVVMDAAFSERFHWGPRPRPAQEIVRTHKEDVEAGRMEKAEVHKQVRSFYAGDHGQTIVSEIVELSTA
jgi:hypothetical protein